MSKNVSHLQHVKSSVVESGKPKLPTAGVLAEGEIAVNYADGYETLSIKSSSGNIKTFSSDEYYTEQKLGSGFTSENSARTVTDVIEENELVISSALNDLNDSVIGLSASTDASISGINEVKLDVSAFTEHTASTVHMSETEKTNLDSLETNIETISGVTQADVTSWNGKADANHTQASSTITSMTSYSVASSASSIETTDTLNEAIGKLEKRDEILEAIHENDATVQDVEDLPWPSGETFTTLEQYVEDACVGARTVNAELSGTVVTITDRDGTQKSVDLLSTTDSILKVFVVSDVSGVDVSGLTINAYYNGSSAISETIVTNENGTADFIVPAGTSYKLTFPIINGCEVIEDIEGVALSVWEAVQVVYRDRKEEVTVHVTNVKDGVTSDFEGVNITVSIDGVNTVYTTDSSGVATFQVLYGKEYTVQAPKISKWYMKAGDYVRTYTAAYTSRGVDFIYKEWLTGLYFLDSGGTQYTSEEMQALIDSGAVRVQDVRYILCTNTTLQNYDNNGQFFVDVDMIMMRGAPMQWATSAVTFNSIPLNGNGASAAYYYDGYTASKNVQEEGDNRGIGTPAVDACLQRSVTLGNETYQGFLGAVGQWTELWANRAAFDEMLLMIRPEATSSQLLSTYTSSKWTVTQYNAASSWYWTTAPCNYIKTNSYAVVPFFAFVSSNS